MTFPQHLSLAAETGATDGYRAVQSEGLRRATGIAASTDGPGVRFVARSVAFRDALRRAGSFAPFEDTVLIEGESGTGKSYFARLLHDRSNRRTRAFSSVNLSELDDALASSELFGHVAGAFTGAHRNRPGLFVATSGGTLFLDEIGKASAAVQQKLLHVVEHRGIRPVGADRTVRVDVRMVLATNVPLDRLASEGKFLPDLLMRVGYLRVRIPPLRERRADIPHLVRDALACHAPRYGYASPPGVSEELMTTLVGAPWHGNHRELDAAVRCLLIQGLAGSRRGHPLTLDDCREDLPHLVTAAGRGGSASADRVRRALAEHGGKVAPAARALGISRATLHRYLRDDPSLRTGREEDGIAAAS
jgi:DNA-binding NtrC family response regulator